MTFYGDNLAGATGLWTNFPAKVTVISATNQNEAAGDKAVFQLIISKETPVGIGAMRLATTNGVSSLQLFMLDDLPSVTDNGSNKTMATAQELKLPTAVDGACDELSFDYYRFRAKRGQRISVETVANRLGSALDPVVRLLDAQGRELVYCDDDPALGADARFVYTIPTTGQYLIEMRDLAYQGGPKYRYHLRVGDFPLANFPFPFGASPGTKAKVNFGGPDLNTVRPQIVKVPNDCPAKRVRLAVKRAGSKGTAFVSLLASQWPELAETEPNDKPEAATKISVPVAVNGRFAKPRDRDFFEFQAQKDQRLLFSGKTRSLGSPCDLFMRLYRTDGTLMSEANIAGANEGTLTNTFKETGTYRLLVEELNRAGGPELAYRIEIEPLQPGFALSVETDKVEPVTGGTFEIKVTSARREFNGPIRLSISGLDDDFALENNVIAEKKNETTLKVKMPSRFQPGQMLNFSIVGKAKNDGIEQAVTASTMPALRTLFPLLRYPPAELDGLIALGVRSPTSKPTEEKPKKKR
ncbi:MAG: hypothetical protein DME26_05045 [Verrucomicrobia bacterium]|nr:MAG: hypothetical protein DME26_05045 [Verrucomicrobiota bacterium]